MLESAHDKAKDIEAPDALTLNAERFKALGHPLRLAILRFIVQGPEAGTPAGEIQDRLGIPASTLSHHLSTLSETGLARVQREGNFLKYQVDFLTLHCLTNYLWEDCCAVDRRQTRKDVKGCCS